MNCTGARSTRAALLPSGPPDGAQGAAAHLVDHHEQPLLAQRRRVVRRHCEQVTSRETRQGPSEMRTPDVVAGEKDKRRLPGAHPAAP